MSILEESQEHSKINNPQNQQATVYLRLVNSKSIKLKLPAEESVSNIKKHIKKCWNIEPEHQIIYYKGKELLKNKMISFSDNSIIHVKNSQQSGADITVDVIKHLPQRRNLFKLSFETTPLKINQQIRIQDWLRDFIGETSENIDLKRTKVIECGRFLKLYKTFQQQKVCNHTQIHLILRKPVHEHHKQNAVDQMLIQSVLKSSKQNSLTDRQPRITNDFLLVQNAEYQQSKAKTLSRIQLEPENQIVEGSQIRRSLPSYYGPTKSSEFFQSQKVIKKQLTPLKFHLREYKKYEGPKSIRECTCKRKDEFYVCSEGQIKTQDDSSPQLYSPSSSRMKGLKRLRSKLSLM